MTRKEINDLYFGPFGRHDLDFVSVLNIHIRHPGNSQMLCKLAVTHAPPRFKVKPDRLQQKKLPLSPAGCPDQDVAEAGAAELLCATAAAVKRGYGLGVSEFSSIKWQCVGPSACETVT